MTVFLEQREKAWRISHRPFIGRWRFLRLEDYADPCYQQVRFRLMLPKSEDVFLDLGCGLGQSLRQLRHDGVHPDALLAADIESRFIDAGYDLFRDADTLGAKFFVGDLVDPDDRSLDDLCGKATIVHMGSFFHLFTRAQQLYIGQRLVSFLRPGTKNALIYGRQAGTLDPTIRSSRHHTGMFLHNQATLQELWDEVGELTGTRWLVQLEQDGNADAAPWGIAKGAVPVKFAIHQIQT